MGLQYSNESAQFELSIGSGCAEVHLHVLSLFYATCGVLRTIMLSAEAHRKCEVG